MKIFTCSLLFVVFFSFLHKVAAQPFVVALNPNTFICTGPNAVIPIIVGPEFTGPVDVTITTVIGGFPYSITLNDIAPGDTTDWILTNTALIPPGYYTVSLSASDGTNSAGSEMDVYVLNEVPGAPTLISPTPNAISQPLTIVFDWSANGAAYDIQVATDAGFTNLITNETGLPENTYQGNYNPQTTYFWRVKSTNPCGPGPWSSVLQFTTSSVSCETYIAADVPAEISPSGQVTVTSVIEIQQEGIITDVNVLDIIGTHSWLADLNFSLTSPSGTTVELLGNICGDLDDFNISLDDEATGTIPCPYNDGGIYPPIGALSDFIGESAFGTWTLTIFDDANEDGGILEGWVLELCLTGIADVDIDIQPTSAGICQGLSVEIPVYIGADFFNPVSLSLTGLPADAFAAFNPNPAVPGSTSLLTILTNANTPAGDYNIQVSGSDGMNNSADDLLFSVAVAVGDITLLTPANGASDQALQTTFTWDADPDALTYTLEVALDDVFSNILFAEGNLITNNTTLSLQGGTTYFWRVRAENVCGEGNWSTVSSFSTVFIFCNEYQSTDVPWVISDGPPPVSVSSTLVVPAGGNILDIDVINLSGLHTYLGDIRISLTSPAGTTVVLVDRICGTEENFDIIFDDEATLAPPCPYDDGNAYLPEEALSDFDGELAVGTWTLTIEDEADVDGGILESWGLLICMTDYDDYSLIAEPAAVTICGNTSSAATIHIGEDFDEQGVTLSLLNVPSGLEPALSSLMVQPGGEVTLDIENVSALSGTYNLTLNANDGTQNTELNIPVLVFFLPSSINVINPLNNSNGVGLYPVLNWEPIIGINSYHIIVATDPSFLNILYDETVTEPLFAITDGLDNGTVYYWQVSISNACGESSTGIYQFTTIADLSLSANPQELNICEGENGTFVLEVGNGFGPDGALISANNPVGTTVNYSQNPIPNGTTAVVSVVGLNAGITNITFTATGINGSNNISVSYIVDNGPAAVTLQSPPNGATGISLSPNFIWNGVSDATSYEFILALDPDLTMVVFQGTLTGTAFSYSGPLESGTTYYWTVIAHNECLGTMSAVYQFNTQTVGTADINKAFPVEIFPNPASDWVDLSFGNGLAELTRLEYWSVNGLQLGGVVLDKGTTQYRLSLSTLPAGVYLLKLIQGTSMSVSRVVVQR